MDSEQRALRPVLGERRLKTRHAVITSLAVVTPTGTIFFLTIPAAAAAGKAMPLAFLLAFGLTVIIANAIYRFTQRIAHAGSFFAFAKAALGPRTSFMTGWLVLAFYPIIQIFSLLIFGAFVSQILAQHAGLNIQWWWITLVGLLLIWIIAFLGIKLSIRTDLAFLAFEAVVLIALAVTIILKGGAHGAWHPGLFTPQGIKVSGIALGVVFGVLGFTGFEAAAYLGEEAHNPRQIIPRAIIITTLLTGLVYVVFAYVATVGWGAGEMAKYGQNAAPWDVLAGRYWNSGSTIVVDIAAAIAVLAGGLASQNGGARMVFALARDGMLPKALSRVSRFGTPGRALAILLVLAVAVSLGLGIPYGPLTAFSLLTLLVTFTALAVYFLVQVACIAYFWRRKQFHVVWHGVLPVVAMALIVWLFVESEIPAPPYPQNLAFWIALGWAVLGLLIVAGMSVWVPLRFEQLAQILGEEEPGALLPELEVGSEPQT